MAEDKSQPADPEASATVMDELDQPNQDERKAISGKLSSAGLATDPVMVDAYLASGGLPSRVIGGRSFAPALPDLPASEEGRAMLSKLREDLVARLATVNSPERYPQA